MPSCLFCEATTLTRGYIFPGWTIAHFPQTSYTSRQIRETHGISKSSKQFTAECEVSIVCGSCYSGWMNRIEGRARPILRPLINCIEPPLLTADNQRRLAVWACLRAYMNGDIVVNERGR